MDPHQLAEARSLAYHRAVADLLARDATALTRAQRRVDGWVQTGEVHPEYAAAWRDILSRPVDDIRRILLMDDERMRTLRSVTPFAGAIDPRTRWKIWRSVREGTAA
ncbi:MAG: hypothetical protein HYV09_02075 [Deltaproteobacteria bacterium]|nr:hypothetical protein [Deltaproteobacteria bacterium]